MKPRCNDYKNILKTIISYDIIRLNLRKLKNYQLDKKEHDS